MPIAPMKPCANPNCGNLTISGRCDDCKKKLEKLRGTSHQRGYDGKWRNARKRFLASHPNCAECERNDRVVIATVVDHIIPHRGNMQLFWDKSNWQALCSACHNAKTRRGE